MQNGAVQTGAISLGDLDVWSFTANAGDGLMLRMGGPTLTPWLRLYGPDGALVAEANSGNPGIRDVSLTHQATNSGSYTVVVSATFASQTSDYTLHLAHARDAVVVSTGDEGGPLQNGATHPGTISLGDLDVWSFTANAGDNLLLRMGAASSTPWIRVYGPDGALADEANSGNPGIRDVSLTLRAANSGAYIVVVSATFSGQVGGYTLQFVQAPGVFVTSEGDQGGPLQNGAVHAGTIPVGDLDVWSLDATAGDGLMIRMGGPSLTPSIRVYAPDGALAGEASSGNPGVRDVALTIQATNSGPYTVIVGAAFSGQTSDYTLHLAQARSPITVSAGDEGGPLVNGMTNSATLSLGDLDVWSFLGTVGDSNVLRVTASTFTPWIRLYGPNGALVGEARSGNPGVRTASLIHEVTSIDPGLYTVAVSAAFAGQIGDYTFKQSRWAPDLIVPDNPSVEEGATLNVSISAQDPDEPAKPLQFELLSAPPGVLFALDGATNATISWATTEADGPTTNVIAARVTDVVNGRAFIRTNQFSVVVGEINVPPQLTVPAAQTVNELTPLNVTASATDADLPPNPLAFSLISPPEGMTINPATGAISWIPSEAQGPAAHVITVVVTDDSPFAFNEQHLSATNTFTVNVGEVNVPPQPIVPQEQSLDELTPLNVTVGMVDEDLPANAFTFALLSPPAGAAIHPNTGVVSWTPTEAQGPSTNLITVVVTDNSPAAVNAQQLSGTNSFRVIVREVNSAAPQIVVPAEQAINELTPLQVSVTASDADLPANNSTFSLLSPPPGMAIDPATGAISWTPTEVQGPSTNIINVVAADDGTPALRSTNTFTVIVREANAAPTLEPISDRSALNGTLFTLQVAAADADLPTNMLSFNLETAPTGMTIDAATGAISWTPTQAQVGTHSATVRVTDNGEPPLSATRAFQVTVTGQELRLAIEPVAGGLMQIRMTGDLGLTYELQVSSDLRTWTPLLEFRLTTSPHTHIDPESAANTLRFYRLLLKE
jgi:hypothetical protein